PAGRGVGRAGGIGARRGRRRARAARAADAPGACRADRRAATRPAGDPSARARRTTDTHAGTGGDMIGIVGGGLAAAKLVEGYREAGGSEDIVIWSLDPHGPYHRPPLSKRLLRGEAEAGDALAHPVGWYAEHGVDLRLGEQIETLDQVQAETVVIATGARP